MQPNHTVSEDISLVEVCIQVFNPLQDEDLMFDIDLIIQPRIGDAGKIMLIIVSTLYDIIIVPT